MLDVNTIYAHSAGTTAAYYTQYLTPDGTGERPGIWCGRGAATLGLEGEVQTDDLEALLSGHHPGTGEQLGTKFCDRITKHGTVIEAVAGFDGTFSAPKSVSVLWALTGDDGWSEAHDIAVAAVVDHVERYGATTRVRVNGPRSFPDATGLTMAIFPQSTSREDDPQLHTHWITSSKVQLPDGRWYALDASYLKDHQRALGGLYQSVLRAELSARYGVEWEPIVNGQAEIAGLPDEILELFSKRTRQVEALRELLLLAFNETEGRDPTRRERAAISRQAAADSRRDKSGIALDQLLPRWRDEADAIGWTGPELVAHARDAAHTAPATDAPTVEAIVDALSANTSAWNRVEVLSAICDLTPVQPGYDGAAWARCLEATTDAVIADHFTLDPPVAGPVRESDGRSIWLEPAKPHLTHPTVIAQEERILTFAIAAQDPDPQRSPTVEVDGLDVLQADAARAVAGADQLVLVVGPAGTGKTTTLERAATDLARQRRNVFGVAPTAKAAQVLAAETGMRADTVAKLFYEWDRPTGPFEPYRLPAGSTLVVDETGMVGTNSLDRLVGLAQSQQWRLVLVGDPRQLQAVGRCGMFDELCRIGRTHDLATIHRFTHTWEQTATLALRAARPDALDAYLDHDRITAGDIDDHLDTIADAWITHHDRGESVAVTAETNAHVDLLNDAIQDRRRQAGHLDDHLAVPLAGSETASPGDLIVTRRNDRTLLTDHGEPVRNRELWHVDHTHDDGSLTVSRIQGQGTATLPADYVQANVRLGYAATAHGHQGDTVDHSYTLVSTSTSHRGLYVGATRGRNDNHLLVVTEEPELTRAMDVLEFVLTNDRADVPAIVRRRQMAEQVKEARPSLEQRLADANRAVVEALQRAEPFEEAIRAARREVIEARSRLLQLERGRAGSLPIVRIRYRDRLRSARNDLNAAETKVAESAAAAQPRHDAIGRAVNERDAIEHEQAAKQLAQQLVALQKAPVQRGGLVR